MYFIAHVVGFKRFKDGGFDRFTRGDIRKGHGFGRVEEAVEVCVELEDFAVVHAQTLPYGIAALNRAVKDGYFGVFAREQFAADMDEDVFVSRIG